MRCRHILKVSSNGDNITVNVFNNMNRNESSLIIDLTELHGPHSANFPLKQLSDTCGLTAQKSTFPKHQLPLSII